MSVNEERELVEICRAGDNIQAQMIKGLLETHGIGCMLTGEAISRIGPITVDGLGEVPVLVRKEEAEMALRVLKECAPDVLP